MKIQSSLQSQLRKRLAEGKQQRKSPQTTYKAPEPFSVPSEEPEDLGKDIILACILYLRFHSPLYINRMHRAFLFFKGALNIEAFGYTEFCPFLFPSICLCGHVLAEDGCAILNGCVVCKGAKNLISVDYDTSVLSRHFKIEDSWFMYGFGMSVKILGGYDDSRF